MATETEKLTEVESVLKSVINNLQDGQKGFSDLGEQLKDESLKTYFFAESLTRAAFRGDLEAELHHLGDHDIHETGTAAGALHRTWGDIKARLFGADDHSIVATAEQGEDEAKKAYADALKQPLPLPIKQLLTTQQEHIIGSHDFIRNTRNALAAAKS